MDGEGARTQSDISIDAERVAPHPFAILCRLGEERVDEESEMDEEGERTPDNPSAVSSDEERSSASSVVDCSPNNEESALELSFFIIFAGPIKKLETGS